MVHRFDDGNMTQRVIELLNIVRRTEPSVVPITPPTPEKALEVVSKIVGLRHLTPKELALYREVLRRHLLSLKLTSNKEIDPSAEFSGYGDDGDVHFNTDCRSTIAFLNYMVHHHVTFDWYNDEGGGGDITWDLVNDKVIINGYRNITTTETQMSGAEF